MRPEDILAPTPAGVCCKLGAFHIDPTRPVERALITHAHSDHARAGHGAVLATQETLDLMRLRYGENFAGTTQTIRYGESINLGGAKVTFHPAGHVLGSAQIAVEANGLSIVASGDYKNVPDPTCTPFELIAMRRVHHRGYFCASGVPSRRSARRDRQAAPLGGAVSGASPSRRRLFAWQGATRDRVAAPGRLPRADLSAWRHGEHHQLLRFARDCARRIAGGARRHQGRACRHDHALPALSANRSLDPALSGPGHCVRLGLDAHPRPGTATRRRAAARHLRSRRLGVA